MGPDSVCRVVVTPLKATTTRQHAGFGSTHRGPLILTTLTSPRQVVFFSPSLANSSPVVFLLLNSIRENGETPPPSPSSPSQAGLFPPVPPGPRPRHPHPRLLLLPPATMDNSQTVALHHLQDQPSCHLHGHHEPLALRTPPPPRHPHPKPTNNLRTRSSPPRT